MKHLPRSQKSVSLHCVFHSIRFKVNKIESTAVLFFFAHKSLKLRHIPCSLAA